MYGLLKDLVVKDEEDVLRDSEGEKKICNGVSSGTEEVTTTTINMGRSCPEGFGTSKLKFSR